MSRTTWRHGALAVAVIALSTGIALPATAATTHRTEVRAAVSDPTGDVYDDDDELANAPYADVVVADGKTSGVNLVLTYKTAKALNPAQDPNWDSDSTFTDFLLDTNGDSVADFDVEYALFEGELYADVYKVDDQEEPPVLCEGTAAFTADSHTATVALSCLGNPRSIGYRVETVYDQNAADDASLAAYDLAPETGFATVN